MSQAFRRREVLRAASVSIGAGLIGFSHNSGSARAADGAALLPVKVLNASGDLGIIVQSMAKAKGYEHQFGVGLNYQNVADGSKIIPGLINGSADVCTASGFSQVFPVIEKGASLKIIGGCLSVPTLCFYSAKPEIKSIRDLPGKVVAVGSLGSLLHMMTVAVLRKYDVDEKKVRFVNIGSSGASFQAIVAGKVDAGLDTVDILDEQSKYGLHDLAGGHLWAELPNFTMQAAYATSEAIEKKRSLLVRTLATHGKLYRFLSGPESWAAWSNAYDAYFGRKADQVRSRSFWKFIQERKPLAVNLTLSEERFRYIQELNVSLGVQKKVLPYKQVADMSLAEEALKMLS